MGFIATNGELWEGEDKLSPYIGCPEIQTPLPARHFLCSYRATLRGFNCLL